MQAAPAQASLTRGMPPHTGTLPPTAGRLAAGRPQAHRRPLRSASLQAAYKDAAAHRTPTACEVTARSAPASAPCPFLPRHSQHYLGFALHAADHVLSVGCFPVAREGVNSFLLVAEANKSKQGFMCCPCLKCKNEKDYSCSRDIKSHLLRFGFMSSYNVWTKHGEEGVMMEDGDEEEDNDEKYRSMFSECFDTAMDDNEEEGGEEQASDDPVDDDLRRAISDARRDCDTDKERLQFDKMLEDHHKLLYPGCEDGHRKLGSILELLKWKAEVGVTDSGFEKLMIILKKFEIMNCPSVHMKQRSLSAL
ncbi:hypothetical protein QYE76_029740 [Lolium multiflorum]|uniref:Transposase-associated domain-containing protein n=1 Tax=Lolium multiflorum TaxID=4521 RepID=A0AAD8QP57_LOLMU|nr:hypothetical protein QYE76_029740 [Lolium multiflorum]